ncbi:Plastid-lipid-associated protein, chloroplastic [Quillaja saponaria]|uniref:Plastid-lipid-associated protein, chloroplastic n=1 Tax=Quillaja saponaria TaxID=32244 RepID=A0AAD7M0L1_QUISA|nr:Plastid-lipid-associated protein, chloroplastic [Quillaja saponaria]
MAFVSKLNQLPCKTLLVTPPNSQFTSKPSILQLNSVGVLGKSFGKYGISAGVPRPVFWVRAVNNDYEWGPEKEEPYGKGSAVAVAEELEEPTETEKLKKALVDSFYGTDRGLKASSETRAEIVELITQLEAKNPTPAPTEALSLLNGKWILAYTSFAGLFPLLSRGTLPLVKVAEISQTIDSENFTVQNSVQFTGPLATTSISTNAKFEVRSPKRVQIKFEEGIIGTPQLTDSIVIPENVEFLGQKIDFTPFKGLITSVQDTASSVAKRISSQPPFKFSINNSNAESWLLTTYLDVELRISKSDAGNVYVLIKEGSSLLTT